MNPLKKRFALLVAIGIFAAPAISCAADFDLASHLDACNITWDVPGPSSQQSMPIGNGDIGLNVWVEPDGSVDFYIGKTDSWNKDGELFKVGGVHIAMNPSPLAAGTPFSQVLKLRQGEMEIKEGTGAGEVDLLVWVDANHPVIRVEARSAQPESYSVALNDWRKDDVTSAKLSPDQPNTVVWYHRDTGDDKTPPILANRTFGAVMQGPGLVSKSDTELDSAQPVLSQVISIVPLTAQTATADDYLAQLGRLSSDIGVLDLDHTRQAHEKWWDDFWHRSWIFASGTKEATETTEGYVLQRFVTACAGRGAFPIKFNGTIFVVDDPYRKNKDGSPDPVDADYRTWGGGYWYQNTRAMYWPRLQAGDFDELMPLFHFYADQVKENEATVKAYYGHDGSYFAEQRPMWGGLKYVGPQMPANWNDHYFTDVLDLGMMMLDYAEYTGDTQFLKDTAIPMITDGLTFFNEHFYLGPDGKLLLEPDNAIEMYWKAKDPAPDIAGLRAILPRMIALPDSLVDAKTREGWKKMLSIVPELPRGMRNGQEVLLPYAGPQTMQRRNVENPELYAIYPFRLYGLDKPDLDLALRTFYARLCPQEGCWSQDPEDSAMLGLTDTAEQNVHFNLTWTDPHLKFLAFWAPSHDYQPNEDNGGNGEMGLEQMLLQAVGDKLLVFPAWPKDWNVDFKLHAPGQTVVQASFRDGKMTDLDVTPPARKADAVDMSTQPPPTLPAPAVVGQPGTVRSVIQPGDPVVALKQTAAGGPNVLADASSDTDAQGAERAIDGNLDTKYYNHSPAIQPGDPHGDNSGLAVTPGNGGIVDAVQLATANDVPDRDPLAITVEGSNDPNAAAAGGNDYKLLYSGPSGLGVDPGRNTWGPVIKFPNDNVYRTYRVLVTETRGAGADGTQYSEIRLGD